MEEDRETERLALFFYQTTVSLQLIHRLRTETSICWLVILMDWENNWRGVNCDRILAIASKAFSSGIQRVIHP